MRRITPTLGNKGGEGTWLPICKGPHPTRKGPKSYMRLGEVASSVHLLGGRFLQIAGGGAKKIMYCWKENESNQ